MMVAPSWCSANVGWLLFVLFISPSYASFPIHARHTIQRPIKWAIRGQCTLYAAEADLRAWLAIMH